MTKAFEQFSEEKFKGYVNASDDTIRNMYTSMMNHEKKNKPDLNEALGLHMDAYFEQAKSWWILVPNLKE